MNTLLRFCLTAVLAPSLLYAPFSYGADEETTKPDYQLQPLFTRYARTASKITFNSTVRWFEDMELQEADRFDGFSVDADLTVPFLNRFQLRLFYPAYTDGEARLIPSQNNGLGDDIDISGQGGVFDYASAILEYQFLKPDSPTGWNAAVYAGYSLVLTPLDAEGTSPGSTFKNKYNHQGKAIPFGLKADRTLSDRVTILAQAGGHYHYESDDLHPQGGDKFVLVDGSVALVYNPFDKWLYPVLELVYQGDLGSYNTVEIVPEVIVPFCSNFELKGGFGIGLTDDGEDWQARLQATLRF